MYEYICYFIIYAFLGWCTEVAYKAVTVGQFVNRGFLNGPVCPIYGFGMVFVIWALTPVVDNAFLLFAGGFIITTALEWLTGFVLEKLFHAKWWDYSGEPFNIKGYVCLKFSILWALACMLIMNVIHPLIAAAVAIVPVFIGKIIAGISLAALAADSVLTVNTVTKLNRQLRHLSELGAAMRSISDEIGENIFESVADINERNERVKALIEEHAREQREKIEKRGEEIRRQIEEHGQEITAQIFAQIEAAEKIKAEYEKIEQERHFGYGRLLKAFPDIEHRRHKESLEKIKTKMREVKTDKKRQ